MQGKRNVQQPKSACWEDRRQPCAGAVDYRLSLRPSSQPPCHQDVEVCRVRELDKTRTHHLVERKQSCVKEEEGR